MGDGLESDLYSIGRKTVLLAFRQLAPCPVVFNRAQERTLGFEDTEQENGSRYADCRVDAILHTCEDYDNNAAHKMARSSCEVLQNWRRMADDTIRSPTA